LASVRSGKKLVGQLWLQFVLAKIAAAGRAGFVWLKSMLGGQIAVWQGSPLAPDTIGT
jgi:hypothetical protein